MNTERMKEIESLLEKANLLELLKNTDNREYILSFIQPELNNQMAQAEKDAYNKGVEDFYDSLVKYFKRIRNIPADKAPTERSKESIVELAIHTQHTFAHLHSAYIDFKQTTAINDIT